MDKSHHIKGVLLFSTKNSPPVGVESFKLRDYLFFIRVDSINPKLLQSLVGGYIQMIEPLRDPGNRVLIVNEEGALKKKPLNKIIKELTAETLPLYGDVLLAGFTSDGETTTIDYDDRVRMLVID